MDILPFVLFHNFILESIFVNILVIMEARKLK